MAFDFNMIKEVYSNIVKNVEEARKLVNKPLTLSEKILYSHLWDPATKSFERGKDYVDFRPDRIACQDATAQMALLQFMQAGKNKVAVPTTVHCDHLIQAKMGAKQDLIQANKVSNEVFDFLKNVSNNLRSNAENKIAHEEPLLRNYDYPPIFDYYLAGGGLNSPA